MDKKLNTSRRDKPFNKPGKVRTHRGEMVNSEDCILTEDQWVRKDDPDLIELHGMKFLKTSKNIVLDALKNELVHLYHVRHKVSRGIIDVKYSGSDITFVYGYFSDNPYYECLLFDHLTKGTVYCINVELLNPVLFGFSIQKGVYYAKSAERLLNEYVSNIDYRRKGYSIEENHREFEEKIETYNNYKPVINKNIRSFTSLLGKELSFGMEVETISGHLPDHIQYRTGTVICRDGSLTIAGTEAIGAEYVTVPMKGLKGVANIQYLLTELQKLCTLDLKCSMHIHFGGFNTDRSYLIALYNLCYHIQDELFTMFPYYKTNPDGIKSKNYNQKLTNIFKNIEFIDYKHYVDTCYKQLFHFLSGGIFPNYKFNRKDKHHPSGSKWNIASRYFWVNFNNAIFSKRNTIEFRLHTPTLNYMKTIIWLFMCNAIIRFAENNQKELLDGKKFTFKDVLYYYSTKSDTGKFVSEYLWEYFKFKQKKFQDDVRKGDKVSMWDIEEDHKFDFSYNGVSYWF